VVDDVDMKVEAGAGEGGGGEGEVAGLLEDEAGAKKASAGAAGGQRFSWGGNCLVWAPGK
jgi:hypothetical protein